jgi:hypothetical protein
MVLMFNATFNNISVILWQSVLLVEVTGVPRKNHRPAASHINDCIFIEDLVRLNKIICLFRVIVKNPRG